MLREDRFSRIWWWGNLVLVAGAVMLAFWQTRFLPLAPLLFLVAWIGASIKECQLAWLATPLDVPIFALLLTLPITLAVTPAWTTTLEQVWRLLHGIILFFSMVFALRDVRDVRFALLGIWLLVAGLALTSPITAEGARIRWEVSALEPLRGFMHHNVMGALLAITLPLGSAFLLFARKSLSRLEWLLYALGGLALLFGLWVVPSRGAWLGAGLALMVIFFAHSKWTRAALLAGILLALLLITTERGQSLLFSDILLGASVPGEHNPFEWGLEQRWEIWERAFSLARLFPLTGVGMGTFHETVRLLIADDKFIYSWPHAHNIFLQVAIDLGVVGLVAWVLLLVGLTWCAVVMARSRQPLIRASGVGGLGSLLAFVAQGIFDAPLWGMVRASVFVWGLWGFLMAVWTIQHATARQAMPDSGGDVGIGGAGVLREVEHG